jgi:hypothetical protein
MTLDSTTCVKRSKTYEKNILRGHRDDGLQVVEIEPSYGTVAGGAAATAAAARW